MITSLPSKSATTKRREAYRAARRGGMQEKMLAEPSLLIVDLFCGAGGTTTGFALSGVAKVVACINHDHNAIISHWANHPRVKHFEEDMRTLALEKLIAIVEVHRLLHPKAKLVLWASLECTNFSKAKGGMARDADSRTLADHLHRYITALNPDYVMIENVVEFKDWGPMQVKAKAIHIDRCDLHVAKKKKQRGKNIIIEIPNPLRPAMPDWNYGWVPVPEFKGTDYRRWCNEVCAHGYNMEWRQMNSADWGAYTSRNRLFGMFARPGLNLVWPEKTHSKKGVTEKEWNKYFNQGITKLHKWNAVKEVLDFSDEGYSILHRGINMDIPLRQRKDLVEATLERLYMGCIKHIAGGKDKFEKRRAAAVKESFTANNSSFIKKYYGGNAESRCTSVEDPLSVIPTENRHALVNAVFLNQRNGGNPTSKSVDVNGPARTLTSTAGNQEVVNASFLACYYGKGDNTHSVKDPCPTLSTKDRAAILQPVFIYRDFTSGGSACSLENPAGSLLSFPKMNLVQVQSGFIDTTQYGNTPTALDEPANVITANRKWPYLCNLSYGGSLHSVDNASPTLIARQDKAPMYLMVTEYGELAIEIYENDSFYTKKLKEFMALYGIVDIKMRMLKVPELLQIQGFPVKYRLSGSQADQKKFIGNSVVPHIVKAWATCMHIDLTQSQLKKAA